MTEPHDPTPSGDSKSDASAAAPPPELDADLNADLDAAQGARRRSGWGRRGLIVLVLLVALGLGGWFARAPLAGWAMERGLAVMGYASKVDVESIGFQELVFNQLRIGDARAPGVLAQGLTAQYQLRDALRGQVERIDAQRLEVRLVANADGVVLAGAPDRRAARGPDVNDTTATPPEISARRDAIAIPALSIADATLYLETPAGELVADLTLDGSPDEGWALAASAYSAVLADGANVLVLEEGTLEATLGPDGAQGAAQLRFGEIASTVGQMGAARLDLDFDGDLPDPTRLAGLTGRGRVAISADGLGLNDAEAVLAQLTPQLGDLLEGLLGDHRAALVATAGEGLSSGELVFSGSVAFQDGVVSVAPAPGLTFVSDDVSPALAEGDAANTDATFRLRLAAGPARDGAEGGTITLTGLGRAQDWAARALQVSVTGPDGLDAVFEVASAGMGADEFRLAGSGFVAPFTIDGLTLGGRLDTLELETSPAILRASLMGVGVMDGTRPAWSPFQEADPPRVGDAAPAGGAPEAAQATGGFAVERGQIDVSLRLDRDAAGVIVRADPGVSNTITARELRLDDIVVRGLDVSAQAASAQPLATASDAGFEVLAQLVDTRGLVVRDGSGWAVGLPSAELHVRGPHAAPREMELRAQAPTLDAELAERGALAVRAGVLDAKASVGAGSMTTSLHAETVTASGPAAPIELRRAVFDAAATLVDGAVADGRFTLASAEVRDPVSPARFAPLSVVGAAQAEGGRITGTASIDLVAGAVRVSDVEFEHDLTVGRGRARMASPELSFNRSGLQPSDLAPIVRGLAADVTGAATFSGDLQWSASGSVFPATLGLSNLIFDTSVGRVNGLSSTVVFDDLFTLDSDGPQAVSVRQLQTGVDLNDIEALIDFPGDGRIVIERARAPFAGGAFLVEGAVWDPIAEQQTILIDIIDIDLAAVMGLVDFADLEVSGRVSGQAPVVISDRSIAVDMAVLEAMQTGRIAYTGAAGQAAAAADATAGDAFRALRNFEYDTMRVAVAGDLAGDMRLTLDAAGANPDFQDGRPIEFTLNTTGEFAKIIQRAMGTLDLGATLDEARREERR